MVELHVSGALDYLWKEQRWFDFIYIDPPYFTQRDFDQFNDKWKSIGDYMSMLDPILHALRCRLKQHGTICVHVDQHACHHVRMSLDKVFGPENFQNEIIWCYKSGGASDKRFARKHDNLLVYSKYPQCHKFNVQREPYAQDYGDREGFHKDGRMMNDWWDIGILSTTSKERCGYPTQKPIALLERLIKAYTDDGDIILDCFAGSGTTGVAAKRLNRRCVLVDQNEDAIKTARTRLS